MDVDDDERDEVDRTFDQLSQSQSSQAIGSSQKPAVAPPIIPQSNVGQRRNRRAGAAAGDQKLALEPGFGSNPVEITKKKKDLLEALKQVKPGATKNGKLVKRDCFNKCFLDEVDEVCNYLSLQETGDLVQCSSIVYGMRVDATYNDAMSTNYQLQPALHAPDGSKLKTKAEQKLHEATATQSRNLQKLQSQIQQDDAEKSKSPSLPMDADDEEGGGGGEVEEDEGGEQGEREAEAEENEAEGSDKEKDDDEEELDEEQKMKKKDAKKTDTRKLEYSDSVIDEIIEAEFTRRQRNMDRKCDLNPMLMDDERKYRMAPSSILNNEYYQIATARYKDLNAGGLLTYNAKVTHNGRITMMHKRMEAWRDDEARDHTPPTRQLRAAISGLVDNALRKQPMDLPNALFDPADCVSKGTAMSTGAELFELERKTREAILKRDDFNFLDNDDEIEDDDTRSAASGGEKEGEGEGGEKGRPPSTLTPTKNSETGSSAMGTPEAEEADAEMADRQESQCDAASQDGDVLVASVRKQTKKYRNPTLLHSTLGEDMIENGPVLYTSDLASKFQQILFNKLSMGSKVEWKTGAYAEELQAPIKEIVEDTRPMETAGVEDELRELDYVWDARVYRKIVTQAETRRMNEKLAAEDRERGLKRKRVWLPPGEYIFLGEAEEGKNTAIPPDDMAHLSMGAQQPLFRQNLGDENEERAFNRALVDDDDDDVESHGDADEERFRIDAETGPLPMDIGGGMDEDMGAEGGFSDDDLGGSSSIGAEKRPDFTAGDDKRFGEFAGSDDFGLANQANAANTMPSMTVRGTGKADDSHWKGGKPENAKPKKERKKKVKEEGLQSKSFFDTSEEMVMKKKIGKARFIMIQTNTMLMKDSDQLLMPLVVDVAPQLDYDTSLFFKPFFLPKVLHQQYRYRAKEIVDADDDTIDLDVDGRLSHYTRMLDKSIGCIEGEVDSDDVYLSFMKMFREIPDVATQRRSQLDGGGPSGGGTPSAATGNEDDDVAGGGGGGGNDEDFGGGGMEDGMDDGGGVGEMADEEALFVRSQPSERLRDDKATELADASQEFRMRRLNPDDDPDEGDAIATVGDREYHLRLIKLDTVAMKTALSDVLTNPMMEREKLDETLAHFHRVIPSQKNHRHRSPTAPPRGKKAKTPMQAIDEDEELEVEPREGEEDRFFESEEEAEVDYEATMMEVPDAMNVTRALFAPPKEKAKSSRTMVFGGNFETSASQKKEKQEDHIELKGMHTLKSTFTCLPARLPLRSSSDVTVASTIAMILHLANENNLILKQANPDDNDSEEDGETSTYANWMNDFDVQCLDDDHDGSKMARVKKRISTAVEVLTQLSADEDAGDAEKRQRQTEKLLAETAAKQEAEKRKKNGGGGRKRDQPGPSSAIDVEDDSDDDIMEVSTVNGADAPRFKAPAIPAEIKRGTPRKAGAKEGEEGPSSKRARTRPSSDRADDAIIQLDDTITVID